MEKAADLIRERSLAPIKDLGATRPDQVPADSSSWATR